MEVYEREGGRYAVRRGVQRAEQATNFATAVDAIDPGALRLDLGSGPGQYLPSLGQPSVALDGAHAMVAASLADHPGSPAVQADLADLPFGARTFGGVWSSKALQHLRPEQLPLALADVHRILRTGGRFVLTMFADLALDGTGPPAREVVTTPEDGDDLPGRYFAVWHPDRLAAVVEAAGFGIDDLQIIEAEGAWPRIQLAATARRALPDHVGPDMRLLCCGLNPSLHAADAGVGYVTANNRFWPAMALAGLATRDRDPRHLLRADGIGMTDLVKRATARADELAAAEHREGVARLEQLCAWLRPSAVAIVGLAGWRAAVDRRASVGWQERRLGPSPVYVLPSTSGLNAGTSLDDLVGHLLAAATPPAS